jgi:flagellar biosynthesis protein FlhG
MDPIIKDNVTTTSDFKRLTNSSKVFTGDNNSPKKIVVIASSKGGVGKSIISSSIAYYLTQYNKSVTLIDFNLASPGLHTFFNIKKPQKTCKELISQPDTDLNELASKTSIKNLNLICGCSNTLGMAENADYIAKRLIESANKLLSDFVIFDMGSGINAFEAKLFLMANTGILVGTPEPATIAENFSFLKLCVLQRLEQIYKGQNEKISIIKQASLNNNANISSKIISLIKNLSRKTDTRNYNQLLDFSPGYILNMVHDDSDYPYATAIEAAIRENFGLELKQMGAIHFCAQMRASLKSKSINNILNNSNGATACYKKIVGKLINKKQEVFSKELVKIKKVTKLDNNFDQYNRHLICSAQCSLWESCSYQHGGFPCKISYIGFLNTN